MTYLDMAIVAIKALKDRTGSSASAIKKYIEANNKSVKFQQHNLRAALKKGVESGMLTPVKASYKLSDKAKKPPKKKAAPKKASISVDPQETHNPNPKKFALSVKVAETGSFSFNETDTEIEHPIAAAVVALDGVVSIFGVNDFVTVSKAEDVDWSVLIPAVVDAI